ncbi:hypothetical protein CRE_13612 [Caenorhabditis remanei]|uniref:Uncharacterized protein n=1 Tax=Caenorhabditis remanei TaxID=31234 RepID=E3N198_CAERE|nr:hypothetical protein CRE_13612 [Caenorhabditis remanei]
MMVIAFQLTGVILNLKIRAEKTTFMILIVFFIVLRRQFSNYRLVVEILDRKLERPFLESMLPFLDIILIVITVMCYNKTQMNQKTVSTLINAILTVFSVMVSKLKP